MEYSIYVIATSLSGSEHILRGRVSGGESLPWRSEEDARSHLTKVGWTNQRFCIDRELLEDGQVRSTWDDQSVTIHSNGKEGFTYIRGGPKSGTKVSKSDQNKK